MKFENYTNKSFTSRSRLYSLQPDGVGTAYTAGLTSYLVSLAKAHCISPRLLIKAEYIPNLAGVKSVNHSEFFTEYAKTLNGNGIYAKEFTNVTNMLTSRSDATLLTMLPWEGVIPSIGPKLMSKHPKWCAECLKEHRKKRESSYFRLSWGFELYEHCTLHLKPLRDTCPWCNNHQPFIPYVPDLSRCSYCFGWLGSQIGLMQIDSKFQIELSTELIIENMIENNVWAAQNITQELLIYKLSGLVATLASGQKTKLSEMFGLQKSTMASWISKKKKPAFPLFVHIFKQMGISPYNFFKEDFSTILQSTQLIPPHKINIVQSKMLVDNYKRDAIRKKLTSILNNKRDCRPLTKITKELGVTRRFLTYWFMEFCREISMRHKKHKKIISVKKYESDIKIIGNITSTLLKNGEYPSNNKGLSAF